MLITLGPIISRAFFLNMLCQRSTAQELKINFLRISKRNWEVAKLSAISCWRISRRAVSRLLKRGYELLQSQDQDLDLQEMNEA